jgi:hypothetical protein
MTETSSVPARPGGWRKYGVCLTSWCMNDKGAKIDQWEK